MSWWSGSTTGKTISDVLSYTWKEYCEPNMPSFLQPVLKELESSVILPATGLLYVPGRAKAAVVHLMDREFSEAPGASICCVVLVGYAASKPLKDVATIAVGLYTLREAASLMLSMCFSPRKAKERHDHRIEQTFERVCLMCKKPTDHRLNEPFIKCGKCDRYVTIKQKDAEITIV